MKKTLKDYNFKDKKVLVRVDFNVPLDSNRNITNEDRIVKSLPTINYLLENGAKKVIALSHLGRPKGEYKKEFSLDIVGKRLGELLDVEVEFIPSPKVVDDEVRQRVEKSKAKVILLENTRFRKEEEKNGEEFAKELANLGDIYVNDAFGTSHRAHASNVGLSKLLPSALGLLVEDEVKYIQDAIENPKRPFIAILGGAKVSDKIGVIKNLLKIVDKIIIVGAMAYTFRKSQGYEIGKSLVEDDKLDEAKRLLEEAENKNVELILPVDVVVTKEIKANLPRQVVDFDKIPKDLEGVDIGDKSIKNIEKALEGAKTVIWNGPCGIFEIEDFAKGTNEVARMLSELKDAITIIGGGDSASAAEKSGYADKISHISTGGGASLEMLEGKILPGIDAVENK